MDIYLTAIKDILVVVVPIIVAMISYRSSKKTQKDIKLEAERIAKEKEAETKQIVDKISAELKSQKELISWENSMPQTNDYTNLLGAKRFGHVAALNKLCQDIYQILPLCPSVEMLTELNQMLDRIEMPKNDEELFPFEVPIILNYRMMRNRINEHLRQLCSKNAPQEDATHANS